MSLENCTGYPEMPKDSSECVKLLRQFNEWRRFDGEIDEEGPAMPHPKSIGFAIDMAIRLIEERGELLAALNDAATSLETIAIRSYGESSCLDSKQQMRGFAASRARFARKAIASVKASTP